MYYLLNPPFKQECNGLRNEVPFRVVICARFLACLLMLLCNSEGTRTGAWHSSQRYLVAKEPCFATLDNSLSQNCIHVRLDRTLGPEILFLYIGHWGNNAQSHDSFFVSKYFIIFNSSFKNLNTNFRFN